MPPHLIPSGPLSPAGLRLPPDAAVAAVATVAVAPEMWLTPLPNVTPVDFLP